MWAERLYMTSPNFWAEFTVTDAKFRHLPPLKSFSGPGHTEGHCQLSRARLVDRNRTRSTSRAERAAGDIFLLRHAERRRHAPGPDRDDSFINSPELDVPGQRVARGVRPGPPAGFGPRRADGSGLFLARLDRS